MVNEVNELTNLFFIGNPDIVIWMKYEISSFQVLSPGCFQIKTHIVPLFRHAVYNPNKVFFYQLPFIATVRAIQLSAFAASHRIPACCSKL